VPHDPRSPALEAIALGKRYGKAWALRDCSLAIPPGRVAALVGPNGAGKSTLLHLAVGLTDPSVGAVRLFGRSPRADPNGVLPRLGFVAQDHPLYRRFTVADLLTMGRKLNPHWDNEFATARLARLGIPLDRPAGKLSGGQQAQVALVLALVLALAKRPELLVLDEPLASLDPLARREFLQTLMEAVAVDGLTVLLSSHILADLERVCDFLLILAGGRMQLAGELEEVVRTHRLLVGPRGDPATVARIHNVIHASHTERQATLLVRANGHVYDACWDVRDVALEEVVLAYMSRPLTGPLPGEPAGYEGVSA
jgi:ABC-2 type transport system ATP-binding protein